MDRWRERERNENGRERNGSGRDCRDSGRDRDSGRKDGRDKRRSNSRSRSRSRDRERRRDFDGRGRSPSRDRARGFREGDLRSRENRDSARDYRETRDQRGQREERDRRNERDNTKDNDRGNTRTASEKLKSLLTSHHDRVDGSGEPPSKAVKFDDKLAEGKTDEEDYDDEVLKQLESFIENDGEIDEEKEAARLAEERRKRREEILQRRQPVDSQNDLKCSSRSNISEGFPGRTTEAMAKMAIYDIPPTELSTASGGTSMEANVSTDDLALLAQSAAAPALALTKEQMDEADELAAERDALEAEAKNHRERMAFDMFSSSPSELEGPAGAGAGATVAAAGGGIVNGGRRAMRAALLEGEDPHLQSNWDDGEGYYKPRIGEMIGERYQTLGVVGKGVFSVVIKCVDLRAKEGQEHVAIKVIRNNDTMRKAAEKERAILLAIAERDPDDKRHCVRMLANFDFRNHVAMVFEYQQMNLRETLKKFGKDVGINIGAVRLYARQLFIALRLLMDIRVVHADIKLDNILCSGDLKQVKLCDFGSAFRETDTDNDPTPYLVSRFYRAPEIILGLQYDRAIDLWSVAVCLYELFTGHVMFPGRTNNEMLRLMMAMKGRIANKQLKSHLRSYESMNIESHFDPDFRFRQQELDPVTGKVVVRLVDITQPTKDLGAILRGSKAGSDDGRLVASLADLLDKCLNLDPTKRLTVSDALKHPFFYLK